MHMILRLLLFTENDNQHRGAIVFLQFSVAIRMFFHIRIDWFIVNKCNENKRI